MTVSSTQNRAGPFIGNDVDSVFDFLVSYQNSKDVKLFRRNFLGIESQLVAGSDYALQQLGTGGRVTLASALPASWLLSVVVDPDPIQETDLADGGAFSEEDIERAFDYQAMVSRSLRDRISRSLQLHETDVSGSGAYEALGNRITNLHAGTADSDAVTVLQLRAALAALAPGVVILPPPPDPGGGTSDPAQWPTTPPPQSVISAILSDPSLTNLFVPLNSQLGNLAAQVLSLNSADAGINTALADLNSNFAALQDEVDLLSAISGDTENIVTLINTETSQRIAGDNATASVIAKIGAADADGVSFLLNIATAKIGPAETLASRFSAITSSLGSNSTLIANESAARTTADAAFASSLSKLGALSSDGTAFIVDLNTTKVAANETLAQRLSGIATSINGNSSAILTEQNARASADASLASSISTIQSTVSGFSVSIAQNATAINGVGAKYTVKIDNNGFISGYGLISDVNNGTPVSTFSVLSDKFIIAQPGFTVAPFLFSSGVAYLRNVVVDGAVIANASITNAKIASLAVGALNIIDGAITNAKIGNLEVNSAKIADLTVGTTKITDNATSQVASGQSEVIHAGPASVTITSIGKPVVVMCDIPLAITDGIPRTYVFEVRRDSTVLRTISMTATTKMARTPIVVDVPPGAGTYTYSLNFVSGVAVGAATADTTIVVLETKK